MKLQFLSIQRDKIIIEGKREVVLRGVNLGGWLMMEGYILGEGIFPSRDSREGLPKN